MALDRESIEKHDFPIGPEGYDRSAVNAHLRQLADELDEANRSMQSGSESVASATGEHVRAILEAAETGAAQIRRQAEEDAQRIKAEASNAAAATRAQAASQAREDVGKLTDHTAVMLQRLGAMESELSALIESLRTGSHRLTADLQVLERNLAEARKAVPPRPGAESTPPGTETPVAPEARPTEIEARAAATAAASPSADTPAGTTAAVAPAIETPATTTEAPTATGLPPPNTDVPAPHGEVSSQPVEVSSQPVETSSQPIEVSAQPVQVSPPSPESFEHVYRDTDPARAATASQRTDRPEDTDGARLIALNMALNGTPREETDRYLAENFQLPDRGRLLNEIYASVHS